MARREEAGNPTAFCLIVDLAISMRENEIRDFALFIVALRQIDDPTVQSALDAFRVAVQLAAEPEAVERQIKVLNHEARVYERTMSAYRKLRHQAAMQAGADENPYSSDWMRDRLKQKRAPAVFSVPSPTLPRQSTPGVMRRFKQWIAK